MAVHFPLILVVDDDPTIIRSLRINLEADGFDVLTATTGQGALNQMESRLPDLMVLDLLLPDAHGFDLAKRIKSYLDVPIIMLTGVGDEDSIVDGLQSYAEDYVVKPFSYRELVARINRVLKRTKRAIPENQVVIVDSQLRLDFARHRALLGSTEVKLTPSESRLLALMARNPNQVISTETIMDEIWPDGDGDPGRLWVNIARVRGKIESNPRRPQRLLTERGLGYRLRISP